jgi:hypothetical protein
VGGIESEAGEGGNEYAAAVSRALAEEEVEQRESREDEPLEANGGLAAKAGDRHQPEEGASESACARLHQ